MRKSGFRIFYFLHLRISTEKERERERQGERGEGRGGERGNESTVEVKM